MQVLPLILFRMEWCLHYTPTVSSGSGDTPFLTSITEGRRTVLDDAKHYYGSVLYRKTGIGISSVEQVCPSMKVSERPTSLPKRSVREGGSGGLSKAWALIGASFAGEGRKLH